MADREQRRAQVTKHEALRGGACASDTEATGAAATVYEDGEGRTLPVPQAAFEETETVVTTAFAPEALVRFGKGKTVVVDPASFMRPGGAYEDGAFGPEQILCSESNLYQVLRGIKPVYHDKNRDYRCGQLFSDRAAYLPGVVFSCGGSVRKADVVAVAEPVRAHALENHRSERECDRAIADRVEALLRIAAANGCETLVCGAFGCGRNGYDAARVTELFRAWIEAHPGVIGRIVFAVPRAHFPAFDQVFGAPEPPAPEIAAAGQDDEDALDPSSIELPEGVTLR